jgi:hypothetical protein
MLKTLCQVNYFSITLKGCRAEGEGFIPAWAKREGGGAASATPDRLSSLPWSSSALRFSGRAIPLGREAMFTFDSVVLYLKQQGMPAETIRVPELYPRGPDENRDQGGRGQDCLPHPA